MEKQNNQPKPKIGEPGYVNKNCWLARNLGYPPSKRCQYCELRFRDCLFEHYLLITLVLVSVLLAISYLIEQNISKSLIVSFFVLIIAYGYFFSKSTEKIIVANFEEKKAKNAFKDLSDNLQQKVDDQTKEIRRALEVEKQAHEELKRINEAKNNFMMVTQHHLRMPMVVIRGYVEMLLAGSFGKLSKKAKDIIEKIDSEVNKEIDVVNELLDVSEFQLNNNYLDIKQEPVKIDELIKEIVANHKPEADKKGISIKLAFQNKIPESLADKPRLTRAINGVIDNAVKYTKQGEIDVEVKNAKQNSILITLKDTGIGLTADELKNIFVQSFFTGEQAKRINAVGRGVSLFMASKIIQGHGGRIWAESEGRDKGSTFYIELPLTPGLEEAKQ